jgi:hypothetical protein
MARESLITFVDRVSDSPFIERVWRSRSEDAGVFHSIAACHWEMVVTQLEGRLSLTVRGPETVASLADLPAHGEWLGIRFKLGTCMPLLPPGLLRDCNAVTLPGATNRSFWLNGSAVEYPGFGNAETFVKRLVRAGLIFADPAIDPDSPVRPESLSTRTTERRFRKVTGLTHGAIRQIERARRATLLLREGVPLVEVAGAAGYYDQPHLTRSLKRFIGLTPAQIAEGERQLSFLYNTPPG